MWLHKVFLFVYRFVAWKSKRVDAWCISGIGHKYDFQKSLALGKAVFFEHLRKDLWYEGNQNETKNVLNIMIFIHKTSSYELTVFLADEFFHCDWNGDVLRNKNKRTPLRPSVSTDSICSRQQQREKQRALSCQSHIWYNATQSDLTHLKRSAGILPHVFLLPNSALSAWVLSPTSRILWRELIQSSYAEGTFINWVTRDKALLEWMNVMKFFDQNLIPSTLFVTLNILRPALNKLFWVTFLWSGNSRGAYSYLGPAIINTATRYTAFFYLLLCNRIILLDFHIGLKMRQKIPCYSMTGEALRAQIPILEPTVHKFCDALRDPFSTLFKGCSVY